MKGKEKASSLLKEYPYTGVNWIYELLDHLDIRYFEEKLDKASAIITSFKGKTAIIVDRDSSSQKKREYIAHELGHYFFHSGNMLFYKRKDPIMVSRDERRAEEFALYLLVPEDKLSKLVDVMYPPNIYDLAEEFGVTVEFMEKRLKERGESFR